MPCFLGCQSTWRLDTVGICYCLGSLSGRLLGLLAHPIPLHLSTYDSRSILRVHCLAYSRHRTSKFAPTLPYPVPAIGPDCQIAVRHRPWGPIAHPLPAKISSKLSTGPLRQFESRKEKSPKLLASLLFWTPYTGPTPNRPSWCMKRGLSTAPSDLSVCCHRPPTKMVSRQTLALTLLTASPPPLHALVVSASQRTAAATPAAAAPSAAISHASPVGSS